MERLGVTGRQFRGLGLPSPVVFNGCVGFFHEHAGTGGETAVLLCPAFSHDALHSHLSMRRLAKMYAVAGYPTLGFQYAGTGDSGDPDQANPAGFDPWRFWQRSLNDACDWLRLASGARSLVLVGLRLGATLATLVAEQREDVAGLVLLAPVVRGHSYVRQLQAESVMERSISAGCSAGLDFHELCLTPHALETIGQADLRSTALRPGLAVAVFQQAPSRPLQEAADNWAAHGAAVTCASFEPLQPMLQQGILGDWVPPDFSSVIEWTQRAVPPRPVACTAPRAGAWAAVLDLPRCQEAPVRFGPADRLFGVFCRPLGQASDMAVVIVNSGLHPHYGVGRFAVEFARRLAADGIASLRMDFAGVGDSLGPPGQEDELSPLFAADRTADIRAAIGVLQNRGFHRFALHGNCAGAFHAYRCALAEPKVGTLLLLNMPIFEWQEGDTVEAAGRRLVRPSHYLRQLTRRSGWARLWRGGPSVGSVVRAQIEGLRTRLRRRMPMLTSRTGPGAHSTAPLQSMSKLASAGVRMLLLFAPNDSGLGAVEQAFGHGGCDLRRFAGVQMTVMTGIDHVLSASTMRREAAEQMIAFLAADALTAARGSPPQAMPVGRLAA